MINSVNSLEFLKSKLLTMDKYNSTTTKLLPPSSLTQARTFATISDNQKPNAIDYVPERFFLNNQMKNQDRVRVQHLENHTKLQNNKCCNNFRTLYNISASSNVRDAEMFQTSQTKDDTEVDVVNDEYLNLSATTPLDIQNKSAFNLDLNNKNNSTNRTVGNNSNNDSLKNDVSKVTYNSNNLKFYSQQCNKYDLINKQSSITAMVKTPSEIQVNVNDSQRTEDQDNAYRHIESVHNYAKSKSFEGDDDKISPNGSRRSSYFDDDEDDDEDDNDAEIDNDDNIDYGDPLPDDLDADYEDIFSKRKYQRFQTLSTSSDGALLNKCNKLATVRKISIEIRKPSNFVKDLKDHKMQHFKIQNNKINDSYEEDEVHVDVDVETVEPQSSPITPVIDTNALIANSFVRDEFAGSLKPDHHARRPMNAFLIFCKRHRAIVKERYKNLENRAITKILGDWWASLDSNEKKCFTNLAQQNKDAFFSANPNFKWYKLPAPPLRTLTTRPANTFSQECLEEYGANCREMLSNTSSYVNNHSNYFKLADEAQMGDLSQLMQDKSKTVKHCTDLQQALGETSQFISAHISCNSEARHENHLKKRFHNENSFSSYSSEEDTIEPKKKSARSCKGKRYQELINSGQIASVLKKSKSLIRPVVGDGSSNSDINLKQSFTNVYNFSNLSNNVCQKRSISESENMLAYDLSGFDLEEKIKELPALNLDDYLQRKRNTKKKKKFSSNGKKRGQRSNNRTDKDKYAVTNLPQTEITTLSGERLEQHMQLMKQHQQVTSVVGSQKRKARKESITRRDVSAIEHEVASLLPLTINGCCFFQEAPTAITYKKTDGKDVGSNGTTSQSFSFTSISPNIPFEQNSLSQVSKDIFDNNNVCNSNTLNENISSSTSDLLILAEVAANRTELKN